VSLQDDNGVDRECIDVGEGSERIRAKRAGGRGTSFRILQCTTAADNPSRRAAADPTYD